MKKPNKNNKFNFRLIVPFSIMIFLTLIVGFYWMFIFYHIVNSLPNVNIENLPRHTNDLLFAVLSIIIGIIISVIFKKIIINPLSSAYMALEKISGGDYNVNLKIRGIRAIRKMADKINAMAGELEAVETMRNDLVNNFSHEFKTPIISISGFAKILKSPNITEEERNEYLDIIINESDRLVALSTDVLKLTKLNNTSILTEVNTFNVTEQIRLVIVMLTNKWEAKNIEIDFDSAEYTIEGNENFLRQIWVNLIDNAIKFSDNNSRIIIKIKEKNKNLHFTFADEGKGMSEIAVKHAFERFFQEDLSHKSTGNGIGLAMAKKICDLHKGDIQIIKTDENGSVFEVILPVKQ